MKITQTTSADGHDRFKISDRETTIFLAQVPRGISSGEQFKIQFGDGHYVPERSENVIWLGAHKSRTLKIEDIEHSIKASYLYQSLTKSSQAFYDRLADIYSQCKCKVPELPAAHERRVLGVDLDSPDYPRNTSRYIVFIADCPCCGKPITWGRGCGCFSTVGIESIKSAAASSSETPISWDNVITSIHDL